MVLVPGTLSHCVLEVYEVSTYIFNSVQLEERTKNGYSYVTGGII